MVPSSADTDEATWLRTAMVDALAPGRVLSPRVEQALRTVPRERFLPGVPLKDAYSDGIVTTDRDADGTVLSCTTMPSCVAGMLEQLDVRLGHRILEIGAGTGINAALLAHLAGPAGHVTTIDILPAAADRARQHLAAAGYDTVRVIAGDGALGYAPDAPYDRIIITAAAWDMPPAWARQATPDARSVIPLRISGFTHEVTLMGVTGSAGRDISPVRETRFRWPPAGEHCFTQEQVSPSWRVCPCRWPGDKTADGVSCRPARA